MKSDVAIHETKKFLIKFNKRPFSKTKLAFTKKKQNMVYEIMKVMKRLILFELKKLI